MRFWVSFCATFLVKKIAFKICKYKNKMIPLQTKKYHKKLFR